jgi:hypothetical protein
MLEDIAPYDSQQTAFLTAFNVLKRLSMDKMINKIIDYALYWPLTLEAGVQLPVGLPNKTSGLQRNLQPTSFISIFHSQHYSQHKPQFCHSSSPSHPFLSLRFLK